MLQKVINYESFRSSQENVYNGVTSCKVASLLYIKAAAILLAGFTTDYSQNMSQKLADLKRVF